MRSGSGEHISLIPATWKTQSFPSTNERRPGGSITSPSTGAAPRPTNSAADYRSPGQGADLMPLADQVADQGAAHHTAATGDTDLHVRVGVGSERTVCQKAEMYPQADPTVAMTAMSIAH